MGCKEISPIFVQTEVLLLLYWADKTPCPLLQSEEDEIFPPLYYLSLLTIEMSLKVQAGESRCSIVHMENNIIINK